MNMRPFPLESSGDPQLDLILGGGVPSNSMVLVSGEPGSGKTILTMQLLFAAARQGKRCLYLSTLSEPTLKVIRYMQAFRFFDPRLVDREIVFADLGTSLRQGAESAIELVRARVEELEPAMVAIDNFRVVADLVRPPEAERAFVYDLALELVASGVTAFLVGDYTLEDPSRFAEFATADGILRLGFRREELTTIRELEVLKLRGAAPIMGRHVFEISNAGVSVYPRVQAPAPTVAVPLAERLSTGIAGVDELLSGGLPTGSSTLLQGATGTGKTVMGLQFLLAGARHGEQGILFTFEETPDQLREIGRSLGWDLASLERQDLLRIEYTSPIELSTDRFLHNAREKIAKLHARRAVFDSLTSMELSLSSRRRYKELVYALAKHLRATATTSVLTMEVEQLLGATSLSGTGVSFVADNLIQLRYVELEGRLERAVSVLKARGVDAKSELRAFTIGKQGIAVDRQRFHDLRGVVTGLPSRVDPLVTDLTVGQE